MVAGVHGCPRRALQPMRASGLSTFHTDWQQSGPHNWPHKCWASAIGAMLISIITLTVHRRNYHNGARLTCLKRMNSVAWKWRGCVQSCFFQPEKALNILAVQSLSLLEPSHACGRAEKSRGQQRMHAQGCASQDNSLGVWPYQQNSRKLYHRFVVFTPALLNRTLWLSLATFRHEAPWLQRRQRRPNLMGYELHLPSSKFHDNIWRPMAGG